MPFLEESYDIAVVGAGHAGCEAALAAARMGMAGADHDHVIRIYQIHGYPSF